MNEENKQENIPAALYARLVDNLDTVEKRVAMCRTLIDNNSFLRMESIEELSWHYEMLPEMGGLTYNYENYFEYYEDYSKRNITSVTHFVKNSLTKEDQFEATFQFLEAIRDSTNNNNNSEIALKYETARALIRGLNDFRESNFTNVNPFGLTLIPTKERLNQKSMSYAQRSIFFDVKDVVTYFNDWTDGVTFAGYYLQRVIQKDPNIFMDEIIKKVSSSSAVALLEWIINNSARAQADIEAPIIISIAQYMKALTSKKPEVIASAVDDAYNFEVLWSVIRKLKEFPAQLITTRALLYLNSNVIEYIYLNLNVDLLDKCIKILQEITSNSNEDKIFSELLFRLESLELEKHSGRTYRGSSTNSILNRIFKAEAPEDENADPLTGYPIRRSDSVDYAQFQALRLESSKPRLTPDPNNNNNNNNSSARQQDASLNNNWMRASHPPLQFSLSTDNEKQKQKRSQRSDPNNNNNNNNCHDHGDQSPDSEKENSF